MPPPTVGVAMPGAPNARARALASTPGVSPPMSAGGAVMIGPSVMGKKLGPQRKKFGASGGNGGPGM